MATTPVSQGAEIRDAADGALAVTNATKSADVRLLLATPVGSRDEHITIPEFQNSLTLSGGQLHFGAAAPLAAFGNNDDVFWVTAGVDKDKIYKKAAGAWSLQYTLVGGAGSRFAVDTTARDALTGLVAEQLVFVKDNGSGSPALYGIEAVTDGAWATSTKTILTGGSPSDDALYIITARANATQGVEPTVAELTAANGGAAPTLELGDDARILLSDNTVEWWEWRTTWSLISTELGPGVETITSTTNIPGVTAGVQWPPILLASLPTAFSEIILADLDVIDLTRATKLLVTSIAADLRTVTLWTTETLTGPTPITGTDDTYFAGGGANAGQPVTLANAPAKCHEMFHVWEDRRKISKVVGYRPVDNEATSENPTALSTNTAPTTTSILLTDASTPSTGNTIDTVAWAITVGDQTLDGTQDVGSATPRTITIAAKAVGALAGTIAAGDINDSAGKLLPSHLSGTIEALTIDVDSSAIVGVSGSVVVKVTVTETPSTNSATEP